MLKEYWEQRASVPRTKYKGEAFYTITELPFYYDRRKQLLAGISSYIVENYSSNKIKLLDFGCGDGFYAIYFASRFPNLSVYGSDLSQSFIESAIQMAKKKNINCIFRQAESSIPFETNFDIIFCFAVFAHLSQSQIKDITTLFCNRLNPGGIVLLFEQTSEIPRSGELFFRRTEADYISVFKNAGFSLVKKNLIAYPFFSKSSKLSHRILSYLSSGFRKLKISRLSNYLSNTNSSLLLPYWELLLLLSRLFDRFIIPHEGNTLFVFKKD